MTFHFEQVAGPFNVALGGVVDTGDRILFAAVANSQILQFDPRDGQVSHFRRFSSRSNGLALGREGALFACQEGSRRVVQLHADGSATVTCPTLDGKYHNHPSDATVDSAGRIWFCDPYHAQTAFGPQIFPGLEHASVLRLERGANHRWNLKRMSFDTVHPRCLALSPDEKTLYVADGDVRPGCVRDLRAYPIEEDGSLGAPSVLLTFGGDHRGAHRGIEGLCVDRQGHVLACGGWQRSGAGPCLYVFAPDGHLMASHPLPDDLPMRCALARGSDDLYLTTGTGRLWRAQGVKHWALDRFDGAASVH